MANNGLNERQCIFENLKATAVAVVKTFGRNCEVAIHDFERLPNSVIHIEGSVTKRKPGAPITDLALRALRREGDNVADMCNYKTLADGGRVLKSSTVFIRDSAGKVIGAYCVNFCISEYLDTVALLEDFTNISPENTVVSQETFALSVNETLDSLMETVIKKAGKQPTSMNKEEKVNLVGHLDYEGAFIIKGAVDFVAKTLGVSKYTVYNYIKEVRSGHSQRDVM